MVTFQEIPLRQGPQAFALGLNGTTYSFRLVYANTAGGGWLMDIGDAAGVPIICGIPLTTGLNLLGQYAYLGLRFGLYVKVDGMGDAAPSYEDIGNSAKLYVVTTS